MTFAAGDMHRMTRKLKTQKIMLEKQEIDNFKRITCLVEGVNIKQEKNKIEKFNCVKKKFLSQVNNP